MRVKTHIDGFDDVLNGGIPKGSIVLISGTTGTMKSAFAYSVLYNNAVLGTKCVYVALQQNEKNLLLQMENFGWVFENARGSLYILDRHKLQEGLDKVYRKTFLDTLLEHLVLLKQDFNYDLVAIDCLSALGSLSESKKPRSDMFRLFDWLRKLETTSFLIGEISPDTKTYGKYEEEYLADGIIHLKMEEISEVKTQRRIRCVKMRTTMHSADWYALLFKAGKFQITEVMCEAKK